MNEGRGAGQETYTITLPAADWQLIQIGLGELQAKYAVPVMGRLQAALAAAQNPPQNSKNLAEAAQ